MEELESILVQLGRLQKSGQDPEVLRSLGLRSAAVTLLCRIGAQEIAADYIVPKSEDLVQTNTMVPFLPKAYICFAETGSGDLWLLSRKADEVAFLDHDQESRAVANRLGIGLEGWVRLAWFMRGFYAQRRANRGDPEMTARLAESAKAFLSELSPKLRKRYPFRIA